MYRCESWTIKKAAHLRIDAFELWCVEKTLENPLDCEEIQSVHPKGNQSWMFIGRSEFEAGSPILWPPDVKNWLFGKDPDAGKDWRQEEKGTTEDEMVGRHHWFNGHEFEQAAGVGDRQEGLACCNPQGHKESDTTEWLTELIIQKQPEGKNGQGRVWGKSFLVLSKHHPPPAPPAVHQRRNSFYLDFVAFP